MHGLIEEVGEFDSATIRGIFSDHADDSNTDAIDDLDEEEDTEEDEEDEEEGEREVAELNF